MSWLDFANYFLSNQRLHAWSWINRTSLGSGFFWWVFRLLIILAFFPFFVFVLREANKSPTHRTLVGNQREKTTLGRGFLSFFLFIWWQSCIAQILSSPKTFLHISSVFFRSLIRSFLSFFFFFLLLSPILWLGISFLFFLLSPTLWLGIFLSFLFAFSLIGNFPSFLFLLLRVRIDILPLGQGLWWVRILAQDL